MSAYFALVRLYYLADGVKACAPAGSVIADFPEEEVERAIEKGYLREATVGEIAEAEAKGDLAPKKAAAKKRGPKPKAESDEKKAEGGADNKKPEDLA